MSRDLGTGARVAAFVAGLAVLLAAGLGVGRLVGPLDTEPVAGHATDAGHGDEAGPENADDGRDVAPQAVVPAGLQVSSGGYTLHLDAGTRAGRDRPVSLTVTGPDGAAVTAYDVEHGKRLHLVALRRDGADYQHLHPRMAPDGTWRTTMALTPGSWRFLADFVPTGGERLTLGADHHVRGDFAPAPVPEPTRTARVGGYEVALDGDLVAGRESTVTAQVTRGGVPVTDLQPYLGAQGHLVALREGDLAYLHVHPLEGGGTGPEIGFGADVPSAGRYRLFLEFRHRDVVRTVRFTVVATGTGASDLDEEEGDPHGH